MTSLKCYATWENPNSGTKGQDLVDCPMYENPQGKKEPSIACGSMKEAESTNVYCAYESLMKQHGISDADHGCVTDLVGEDNKPLNMEICYCNTDGCNKNCTCAMKTSDAEPEPTKEVEKLQQQVATTTTTVTKKEMPRTLKRNSAASTDRLSLLLLCSITLALIIRI